MAKLSEKYIAGFLDSDGSIQAYWRNPVRVNPEPSMMRLYIGLEFSQKTSQDEVLHKIQKDYGGKLYFDEPKKATTLKIFGKPSVLILNRIHKYLVIKKHYASVMLELSGKIYNRKEISLYMKEQRKIQSLPLPNFPTRKWLAGYFDGDGCLQVRLPNGRKQAQIIVEICSSDYDSEGIDIIKKSFGGSIQVFKYHFNTTHINKLTISMPASKVKKFFGYFSKHCIVKKDQAYFILGCAAMGHFRDGENIKAAIKQLKAQPHRLNEPKPNIQKMLANVKNLSLEETYKGRELWLRRRKAKRQSDHVKT